MSPLAVVILSGVALGWGAPIALGRLGSLQRSPQLAAYLWLAATLGSVGAILLAGLLLLLPAGPLGVTVAELLRTCVHHLRDALHEPPGAIGPLVGVGLLGLTTSALAGGGLLAGLRTWRAGQQHRELLTLAGAPAPGLPGVTVLDHPVALAYCLPGRHGAVVVSRAAVDRLDPGQLHAVLAHEHAHQARRHHHLILAADMLRLGFPWLPAARKGRPAVAHLIELAADDAATRAGGARLLASALATLGRVPVPEAVLGATGNAPTPAERIARLTSPGGRGGRLALLVGTLVVGVPLAAQLLALAGPLIRIAHTSLCPLFS